MTVVVDVTSGNAAAERAQAYVAMVAMLQFEVPAQTLGECVEKWALLMSGSHVSEPALVSALRTVRERCPMISLAHACVTLNIEPRDVLADIDLSVAA